MDNTNYSDLENSYALNLELFLLNQPHKNEYHFIKKQIKFYQFVLDDYDDKISHALNSGIPEHEKINFEMIDNKEVINRFDITIDSYILNLNKKKDFYNRIYEFYLMKYDIKFNNQTEEKTIKSPFKNPETLKLFNYIVDNWNYKSDIKWAYIYNFFDDPKIYHNEYERYVRETQNFNGLFKYYNANSKKVYKALKELKEAFLKNYQ